VDNCFWLDHQLWYSVLGSSPEPPRISQSTQGLPHPGRTSGVCSHKIQGNPAALEYPLHMPSNPWSILWFPHVNPFPFYLSSNIYRVPLKSVGQALFWAVCTYKLMKSLLWYCNKVLLLYSFCQKMDLSSRKLNGLFRATYWTSSRAKIAHQGCFLFYLFIFFLLQSSHTLAFSFYDHSIALIPYLSASYLGLLSCGACWVFCWKLALGLMIYLCSLGFSLNQHSSFIAS